MRTHSRALQEKCDRNNVRLSRQKEQRRIVYGLHGFLANIEAVENEIEGYWIERGDTGHYLYRDDLLWK